LCVLEACSTDGLAPLQLGVGVSGGSEAISHALRAALCSDPASAVVSIDFANAFYTLLRSRMLSAVANCRPEMQSL
jgi:hypothetical protein